VSFFSHKAYLSPPLLSLTFGVRYYDAPVNREDHPEFAAVCFGDIESSHDLIHQDHPAFTLAVQEVCVLCGVPISSF
jgi:hypothetical protein